MVLLQPPTPTPSPTPAAPASAAPVPVVATVIPTVSAVWTLTVNAVLPVAPPTPATALLAAEAAEEVRQDLVRVFLVLRVPDAVIFRVTLDAVISKKHGDICVMRRGGVVREAELQIIGLHVLVRVALAHKQMIVEPRDRVV